MQQPALLDASLRTALAAATMPLWSFCTACKFTGKQRLSPGCKRASSLLLLLLLLLLFLLLLLMAFVLQVVPAGRGAWLLHSGSKKARHRAKKL